LYWAISKTDSVKKGIF